MGPAHCLWGKRWEGSPHAASRHLAGHTSHKAEDFIAVPPLPAGGVSFSQPSFALDISCPHEDIQQAGGGVIKLQAQDSETFAGQARDLESALNWLGERLAITNYCQVLGKVSVTFLPSLP